MNPDTGHLVALERDEKLRKGYERVPAMLEKIAHAELAGRRETFVNLATATPLAEWAKKKRLAKIAAKSRRRNRK